MNTPTFWTDQDLCQLAGATLRFADGTNTQLQLNQYGWSTGTLVDADAATVAAFLTASCVEVISVPKPLTGQEQQAAREQATQTRIAFRLADRTLCCCGAEATQLVVSTPAHWLCTTCWRKEMNMGTTP